MSTKPIFCCTHPRACSTAFERVFMTRRDTLQCIHEPFGDAFYYGPERLSTRFGDDEEARLSSGFSESTFKTIFDRIENENSEGKRIFIKDIIHYLVPPKDQPAMIAPSLVSHKRGVGTTVNSENTKPELYPWSTPSEPNNPTVVPRSMLEQFHWIFLIRDPHRSIPSYFRCTIPPLDKLTGFYEFYPSEAGYTEVRKVFDYLRNTGIVGPRLAQESKVVNGVHAVNGINGANGVNGVNGTTSLTNGTNGVHSTKSSTNGINGTHGDVSHENVEICVLDADDMLDSPAEAIEAICNSIGYPYTPDMLNWDNEDDQNAAKEAFEKWTGFHEDAIDSRCLHAREKKASAQPPKPEAKWDEEWQAKFGPKGAKIIRDTVDACMEDYLYLKNFALKV